MRWSIVWLRRLVFEYGSSPPISLDLCADDEDPSQLIIRPGWDAPHVRCFPRTFCAWPCLLRQVGTVLGSPYDYVVARLAYANPGSRHDISRLQLVSDVAKPVIGIQRLHRVAEHGGVEAGEIVQSHRGMLMVVPMLIWLRELSHDIFHELSVQLELLHHRGHVIRRRRWFVGSTTTTSTTSHPAKI